MTTHGSSRAEAFANYEAMLHREAAERQPSLSMCRATAEEIEMKAVEIQALADLVGSHYAESPTTLELLVFAEELAQCGREGVPFERWRDRIIRGTAHLHDHI